LVWLRAHHAHIMTHIHAHAI